VLAMARFKPWSSRSEHVALTAGQGHENTGRAVK